MRGFTLIEVVMALLVLEVGLLGVVGMFAAATSTMTRAETLERAVAEAQGVLDSLAVDGGAGGGARLFRGGEVSWSVDRAGFIRIIGLDSNADTLLVVVSVVGVP